MIKLLKQRLDGYNARAPIQEEQAVKEILQEIALYALWRSDFFQSAAFQGGTSLRILHGLPRFSEDLDFILQKPDPQFQWAPYFEKITAVFNEFGVRCTLSGRKQMNRAVQQAMLKDDSIGRELSLSFYNTSAPRTLKVKLEIDTTPPEGSTFSWHYLDFPLDCEICAQDLPSNFALKLHALLCRRYLKGRDWYDFAWYCKQKTIPNIPLLANALQQTGPWKGQHIQADATWLIQALREKVHTIDWKKAALDVAPFLSTADQPSLALWNERFFSEKLQRLALLLGA